MLCTSDEAVNPSAHQNITTVAQEWASRATELARWAFKRLVNRTDVCGGYNALSDRGREYQNRSGVTKTIGGPTTHKPRGGLSALTFSRMERHFQAGELDADKAPRRVIGTHAISRKDTSLWGGLDIDAHGEGDTSTQADTNLAAALNWYSRAKELGFTPLLTDSNGKGGYHMRLLFSSPVPSPLAYAFMTWFVSDHASLHFHKSPETFPKQADLHRTPFGNWLRVPGHHHTSGHWSTVYNGSEWLEGAAAVSYILSLTGDSPSCIPAGLAERVAEMVEEEAAARIEETAVYCDHAPQAQHQPPPPRIHQATTEMERRIFGYIDALPSNLSEGMQRRPIAYRLLAFLFRDMNLTEAESLRWAHEWDRYNAAPLGFTMLSEVLQCVDRYGQNPFGCGIDENGYSTFRRSTLSRDLQEELAGLDGIEFDFRCKSRILKPGDPRPTYIPENAGNDGANASDDHSTRPPGPEELERLRNVTVPLHPHRSSYPLCHRCQTVNQEHLSGDFGRTVVYGCNRFDCSECGDLHRDRWRFALKQRWGKLADVGSLLNDHASVPVFEATVTESAWPSFRKRLSRAGARYWRATLTDRVFSTVFIRGTHETTAAAAIEFFDSYITNFMTVVYDRQPITTSQGFGKIEEVSTGKPMFRNVSKGPSGIEAVQEIIDIINAAAPGVMEAEVKPSIKLNERIRLKINFTYPPWWCDNQKAKFLDKLGGKDDDDYDPNCQMPTLRGKRVFGSRNDPDLIDV